MLHATNGPGVMYEEGELCLRRLSAEDFDEELRLRLEADNSNPDLTYWKLQALYDRPNGTAQFGRIHGGVQRDDGLVALVNLYGIALGSGELGYLTRPSERRKGYARWGARAMLHHAFEGTGLSAVVARVVYENTASQDLLASLNFTRLPCVDDTGWFNYAILPQDFCANVTAHNYMRLRP